MRAWLHHLNELETPVCRAWSHPRRFESLRSGFAVVSRLGDGLVWYSLIAILPLADGWKGLRAGLHMLVAGGAALVLYKCLKGLTKRQRPCHYAADIAAVVAPLDHYSFPSGHTLHAVSFTSVAVWYYPGLAWPLVPFTLAVATSRIVLGLHFPSDVLVAAGLGLALAYASIRLVA